MPHNSKSRDVKHALTSIKNVLDSIQNINAPDQDSQNQVQKKGSLELMLRKMRVVKLSQVFVQKLSRGNLFTTPTYHHLQSQKQKNDNRIIKIKGFSLDSHLISVIYLLDIIFCLITFVTGSFRAFISAFKSSGDADSGVFIGLMIAAIVVTSIKILVNCTMVRIEDGILMEYITDIWMSFFKNRTVFIDTAFVAINIALLALSNDSSGLSVALFIISIIKLFSLYENLRTFQVTFINSPKKQQYFNLLKVALFNIFFAHFVASMLLAMSLINEQENWKVVKGIDQEQWYIQYIWAFYWACTIIMTVGFGDFSAFFFKQAIIVAFIQLFSCIVLAFNISQIGSIIMNIRASQTEFRRKIAIFKRMAKQNQIDDELQRRIQGYLREQTEIKQTFQFNQQNELLAEIPQNLRNEYIIEANKILFPDLPFFKNLQKTTLIGFTQKFTGKVYYPGQYLMRLQEGNDSIMILKQGKVGFSYKKYGSYLNGTIVQEVKVVQKQVLTQQGQFVRKMVPILLNTDFLSQTKKINYDIIAQNYSFVYNITYQNFFQVIKQSQIDSSYFFSIRHKHTVVKNQWQQLVCQYCSTPQKLDEEQEKDNKNYHFFKHSKKLPKLSSTKYHTKFDCPKLHYFPLSGISVLKNMRFHSIEQTRDQQYYRKRHRYSTSLVIRKSFFKLYQEARNFAPKRKNSTLQKQDRKSFSLELLGNQKDKQRNNEQTKGQQQKIQNLQTIQRIVRESIEQALTGYKPQFWELQIDKLYNYVNYFPLQNSKNLDFVQLSKGKHHHVVMGSGIIPGSGGNHQKTVLNIMKQLQLNENRKKYAKKQNKSEDDKKE